MPDFGLTKAIRKASGKAKVVRPEEAVLLKKTQPVTPAVDPALDFEKSIPGSMSADMPVMSSIDDIPMTSPGEILGGEAERLSNINLGDYDLGETFQPNFDTITTTDQVKAVVADTSSKYAGKIDEARRGTITNAQLQGLAADLDLDNSTVRAVMERESGGTLNAETILGARQMLNSSAERVSTLAKKIATGQASDIDRIMFRRQLQFHGDFQTQFMGARAETGRALNAFSIPTDIDPAQLARMKETVENMNGHDTDSIARALADVDSTAGVSKLARKYQQSKAMGVTSELFVNSILSGPKTALVNLVGNALFQAMQVPEKLVASAVGQASAAASRALQRSSIGVAARLGRFLGSEDHVLAGEAGAMLHGTLSAVRDGLRLAGKAFRTGRTLDDITKFETVRPRAISAENLLPPSMRNTPLAKVADVIGSVIRAPTERLMAPTDEFFKTLAYRAELERQAYVHAYEQVKSGAVKASDAGKIAQEFMENSPKKAREAAVEYARYVTYQNELGPVGRKMQAALRSVPAATLIAPFIRTPTNIFKAGLLERSPLAVFSRKFREDIKAGGRQRDTALARVTMGSLTSAWVASEVAEGNITGGGPQNEAARQLLQAQGWRPYSIRWTDPISGDVKYTSYARLEPLAFVIGATADAVEILSFVNSDTETMKDEESKTWEATAAIIAGIANNTMSKTFMKGLADFSEVLSDPKRYTKQWAGNFATAFIPYSAMRRQIGQIQDPYMREAWTIMDKVKTQSGIPGYSEQAPPRRDLFGQPREYAAGDIIGPMSPIPSSTDVFDPVIDQLVSVMEETRVVPVTMPDKRIEGMRLEAEEYDELIRISRTEPIFNGRTFRDELDRVMSSAAFGRATPAFRAELLKDVQNRADDIARARLERDNASFADRIGVWRAKRDRLRFDR